MYRRHLFSPKTVAPKYNAQKERIIFIIHNIEYGKKLMNLLPPNPLNN